MAINATGTPNTKNYLLGRGIVYLSEIDSATGLLKGPLEDMGNAPAFTTNVDVEELLHQASREGLRVTDKRIIVSRTVGLGFTLDEITNNALELFFTGTRTEQTNQAKVATIGGGTAGPDSGATQFEDSAVVGRHYVLVDDSGDRISLDSTSASNMQIIVDAAGTPATLTFGTDYTVDELTGRIFLKSTATSASGKTLGLKSDAMAGARTTIQIVNGLKDTSKEYYVQFKSVNPANADEPMLFNFFNVQLAPDGDMALIGEEFAQAQFTGTAQKNTNGDTMEVVAYSAT